VSTYQPLRRDDTTIGGGDGTVKRTDESACFCGGQRPSNAYALWAGEVVIGLVDGPSVELRPIDDRRATDGGDDGE